MKSIFTTIIVVLFFSSFSFAQDEEHTLEIDGEIVKMMIFGQDTLFMANLEEYSVSSPRKFASDADYRYWRKCRYHAAKVYPYAVEAIKVFRELEEFSQDARKRERKKHIRHLQKELKVKYEDPLKKLTKTQGNILTEMIERELDISTYHLIKELKGGIKASFWNTMGKMWGYKLKQKYDPEDDPILESVLSTFEFPKEK